MDSEYNRLVVLYKKSLTDFIVARNTLKIVIPRLKELKKKKEVVNEN
jgi:hypothetical protein